MSNIDTRHNIIPFVSGETKALSGQTLLRVLKDKGTVVNKAVSVPPLETTAIADPRLAEFLMECLETKRQELFKALILSRPQASTIDGAEVGIDAIVGFIGSGKALTLDAIRAWYAGISESMIIGFGMKLGVNDIPTQEQEILVARTVHAVGKILELLAGKDMPMLSEKQRGAIRYVLECAPEESLGTVSTKISSMLEKMEENVDPLSALEF